jgi:hypothetical protein
MYIFLIFNVVNLWTFLNIVVGSSLCVEPGRHEFIKRNDPFVVRKWM